VLAYVTWAVVHLGAWGLILLAAAGAGHIFLRKTPSKSFAERCAFTLSLGLGLWALAFFSLGLAGALYPAVIFGLTIAGAAATVLYLIRVWKSNRLPLLPSIRPFPRGPYQLLGASLAILVIAYWTLLLLLTQYPPVQWDATSNHLVLARTYLEQHRIVPVMGVAQPIVPALNHMLFVWGLAIRDDIVSQMMEHTLLMLVGLGIYAWCSRENRRLFGLSAACLWLAHPITIWLGRAAYTDVGVTCFAFLGVYALRVFWNDRRREWWYLSMSMFGTAAATKLSGVFFLALGCGIGFIVLAQSATASKFFRPARNHSSSTPEESSSPIGSKQIVLGWGLALLIAMPWYGFIAYETGNPVWPAFTELSRGVWGAPQVQTAFAGMLTFAAEPRTLESFLKLPFDWKYHSERFDAEVNPPLSPLMLIWPLAWIVALWSSRVRWWAAWALAFTVFWFLNAQQFRYWMPALPMAGLALHESLRWFIERVWKSAVFHNVIWTALILFTIAWGGRRIVAEALTRGVPPVTASEREEFLARSYSGISAVKFINNFSSRDETVCVIGGSWLNYYFRPRVLDMVGPLFVDKRPTFGLAGDQIWMEWLENTRVTWIFIDHEVPQGLNIPKRENTASALGPDYELVFADSEVWIFRRKPIPPDVNLRDVRSVHATPDGRELANLIRLARASSTVSIRDSKSILNFRPSASISNPSLSIPVIFTASTGSRSRTRQ